MPNYISTLLSKTGDQIYPRTVLKAIADDNGNYLDSGLAASDINALKNGKISNIEQSISSLRTWVDAKGSTTTISLDSLQILANPSLRLVTINGNFPVSSLPAGASNLGSLVAESYRSLYATACAVRTNTGVLCQGVLASNGNFFLTCETAINSDTEVYISCTYHY